MSGSTIMVLNLKEIIKKLVLIGVGVVVVALIIVALAQKKTRDNPDEETSYYTPGTYYSEIILHNKPALVSVTVDEMDIIAISLENMSETQEVFYPLLRPTLELLSERIVETQSLDLTLGEENVMTETILMGAIRSALSQAEEI
ncbi:MAG: hypothetical protein LBL35_08830 [Clostridiales bacterium]|jgi:uncharacterized protein with FMN-binding domain|nr:hypothetical protein [Clostridiales bacterium]